MSQYRVSRILRACRTVTRALRASQHCLDTGRTELGIVLWCHAMLLRSTGYETAQAMYRSARDSAIVRLMGEQVAA